MKVIFVGKPGCGKTLLSMIKSPKPHLKTDVDDKIDALEARRYGVSVKWIDSYDDFDRNDKKNVQVIRVPAYDFDKLYNTCNSFVRDPFETGLFDLDSLTAIADNTINYTLKLRGYGKGEKVGIIQIPHFDEWKAEAMFLSSLFVDLKSVPCHVVLTAHLTKASELKVALKKDDNTEEPSTKQLITGGSKIADKIPAYFRELWFFQQVPSSIYGEPPTFKVFTKATRECDLTRTSSILPYEMNVTYPNNLWDQIRKAKAEEKANQENLPEMEEEEENDGAF